MKKFYFLLTVFIAFTSTAKSQCTGSEAAWILGPRNGLMTNTGQLWGSVTVNVGTVGTMVNGRPIYSNTTSTWKGLSYQSLFVGRALSTAGSNYTYFKLSTPLDSNQIHFRVDNIRGDFLNWETQRVRGYLNGVLVNADFKDPVNGAYITGGNTINGWSGTTSLVQSSMRAFFWTAVDSVVIQQTSFSDWIIAELMAACNYILPQNISSFSVNEIAGGVKLSWKNASESSALTTMEAERSSDARHWDLVGTVSPVSANYEYSTVDNNLLPGINYYRLKYSFTDGRIIYSEILKLNRADRGNIQLSVYPNPAKNHLTISYQTTVSKAVLYDARGSAMSTLNTKAGVQQINCSNWPPGSYFLVIELKNGEILTRKILLQ